MRPSDLVQKLNEDVRKPAEYPLTFWGRMLYFLEHHPDRDSLDPDWLDEVVGELRRFSAGETIGLSEWMCQSLPPYTARPQEWAHINNYLTNCKNMKVSAREILTGLLSCARTEVLPHHVSLLLRR